jgi:hypothetical protein
MNFQLLNGVGQILNGAINGVNGLNPAALANFNQIMPGIVPFLQSVFYSLANVNT